MPIQQLALLGAFLLLLGSPSIVAGQEGNGSPPCGKIRDCPSMGPFYHTMAQDLGYDAPGQVGFHGECLVCQEWDELEQDWVDMDPHTCHSGSCGFMDGQHATYALLMASAYENDLDRVMTAALELPRHVRVDAPSRTLEILGCSGEVLWNVALGARFHDVSLVVQRVQLGTAHVSRAAAIG
jgi:hypothetical protein